MSILKIRRKASKIIKKQAKKKKRGSRDKEFLREDQKKIIFAAIEAGMPPRKAADLAGIGIRKFDEWMLRGKKTDARYSVRCGNFRRKVKQLEKLREKEALESIRIMGNGGLVQTKTKVKLVSGKEVEKTTTTKTLAPKWQASAWYLERRCDDYKNENLDTKTPEERAMEINALVAAMKATVPPPQPTSN